MKFWNREKEIKWLKKYLKTEPNAILFIYGPKSSGKSTLLQKIVEKLPQKDKYSIYWYDLRGRVIGNYKDVIDLFFVEKEVEDKLKEYKKGAKLNIFNFITIEKEVKEMIEKRRIDPFSYMEGVLSGNNGKNIIVFDELQKLKEIYLNSPNNQRPLINELFNFFVRLTKVLHLSHVIVMTSDTFFIEQIYGDSTLKNTSEYYLVDYFDDETTLKILKKEGLPENKAKYVINWIGGVPWLIERVLSSNDIDEKIKSFYNQFLSEMFESLRGRNDLKEILKRVLKGENLYYEEKKINLVKELAEKEILFYDPINRTVRFQTRLDERAAQEILKT